MKYLLLTFCLFFNIISAQDIIPPMKFSAKGIGISDGDTFKVLYKKKSLKILVKKQKNMLQIFVLEKM